MTEKSQDCMPRLRFPEFRGIDKWEYNLGEKVFSNAVEKNSQNLNLPILAITQDKGAVPRDEINYSVIVSKESIKNYKIVRKGDFIISLRTFQGGIEYSSYDGLCSPAYILLRKNKGIKYYDSFFTYYFKTPSFIQSLNKDLTGIRDGKIIPYSHFAKIDLPFPPYKEQQKIADCLSSLDELIEAHEQKRDALVEHKKGLMQRLFPAEGENTPRRRFPEFRKEKAWSVLTFEECCNKIMDGTHFSPKTKNGDFMYLSSRNIKDGKIDLTNVEKISLAEHKKIYEKCPVKRGDILLTKDGANTGNCAINTLDCEFSLLSSVAVLRVNNKLLYNSFFYHGISTEYFKKMIKNSMFGQAITRITLEKISQFKISFPALPEQQKIADCLSSLDARIEAEEDKLASLRKHKQGLMQQLFPQSL